MVNHAVLFVKQKLGGRGEEGVGALTIPRTSLFVPLIYRVLLTHPGCHGDLGPTLGFPMYHMLDFRSASKVRRI